MTEGKLYKEIFDKRDSICWCGGEIDDVNDPYYRPPKTCKTKRKPTEEEIRKALDEAKKEIYKALSVTPYMTESTPIVIAIKKCFGEQE